MDLELTDDLLYSGHNAMINSRRQIYERIFKMCLENIKITSSMGELMCMFEIPPVYDYVKINQSLCANYVMERLRKLNDNLKVELITANILMIDWRRS